MKSILSARPDGYGYYYGFIPDDHRQINVRMERDAWVSYVGGERLHETFTDKDEAEAYAVAWARRNPPAHA